MASRQRAREKRATLGMWIALAFLAVSLLVACDSDSSGTSTPTAVAPTGTAEGTPATTPDVEQVLRANLTSEPSTLDPQRASDQVSLTVVRNLYSGLLRLDADDRLVADCASELPTVQNGGISEDGLTYSFRLRDGLTWSDGTPLVAQAFVDGARRLFLPGSGNAYADFYRVIAADGPDGDANVAVQEALTAGEEDVTALEEAVVEGLRVEAPDDQTVVFHLNRRSPEFLLLASLWPLYPVRQDIVDAAGDRWTEAGTLIGNGPFVLDAWDHGEHLRLVRNEHWHGGEVSLDGIEFDMIDDTAVAFLAYQNDELDVVNLGPAELVQVRGNEPLRAQFLGYAALRTNAVYLSSDDPLFSDVRVRQAFAGALDRDQYANAVLEGSALPAYSWIPPGMPGHESEIGLQFQDAFEDARALLAEAGAEGAEVTLLVPEASSAVLTAEWLQAQWQTNLGVTVRLDIRETAAFVQAYTSGDFQISIGGWGADYPDPQNWLPPFTTASPLNFGKYSNATFDDLVGRAATEVDFDARVGLYLEAHRLLIDEAGVVPLSYPIRGALVKPWVSGLVPSPREGATPGDLFFEEISIAGRP